MQKPSERIIELLTQETGKVNHGRPRDWIQAIIYYLDEQAKKGEGE